MLINPVNVRISEHHLVLLTLHAYKALGKMKIDSPAYNSLLSAIDALDKATTKGERA